MKAENTSSSSSKSTLSFAAPEVDQALEQELSDAFRVSGDLGALIVRIGFRGLL